MEKLSLLLVEDNLTIASQLANFFEGIGWSIDHSSTGKQGVSLATSNPYDVIILDINLPDTDGFQVCREIKTHSLVNTPILMLTARDAFEDKAHGFGKGADDYVTKPFEFRELALRCQALGRRNHLHQNKIVTIGDLTIDRAQRIAQRENTTLKLTRIGFDILLSLADAYPQPITRTNLIHRVWSDDPPNTDALRSHIYSLRNELDKPFSSPMLVTLTNVGYKLTTNDEI